MPTAEAAVGISATPRSSRTPLRVLIGLAGFVLLLDQLAKYYAVRELADRDPVEVVRGVLRLRLVFNPGAAFGLASGMTFIFPIIAAGVIVVIARSARQLNSLPWALALGLLLGGALGNLVDRLFREPGVGRGHVVDFLELPHWPVFNVADMGIVGAAVLLAMLSLSGRRIDGTRLPSTATGSSRAASDE